jgi:hypothetical protein
LAFIENPIFINNAAAADCRAAGANCMERGVIVLSHSNKVPEDCLFRRCTYQFYPKHHQYQQKLQQ